ncbi:MAG TPA: PDZ domain-containing protein [Vicinamibacterales bacterium]|nr:PDZ domain-containing protein [Vicinamibacterales bacterium]
MRSSLRASLAALIVLAAGAVIPAQQDAIEYRLSFAERVHRFMDVTATFSDLPQGTLQLRMSRSSPGRYALHEFAKNVLDVRASDASGRPLSLTHPDPYGWEVSGHSGTVRVSYRVFGDRTDGTYLGVDTTHAHINMPSALMWARGLEQRNIVVRFERPAGTAWRVATQLLPGPDALTYRAANLQYLMDSPSEFSEFSERTFQLAESGGQTFRLAVHHDGTNAELDAFAADVEKIVRETGAVWGEYPRYEGGRYTFIADYLPWVTGDGMEHRNSTVLTSPSSLRSNRMNLLDTVAHEFFHSWNVERIRPKSLEPFDFERANMSGELWLAEGFTSYYGGLIMRRAARTPLREFTADIGRAVDAVLGTPGRQFRSAREMSELAPFVDAASSIDRTSFDNTYISYYTWGAAIGLALDLTLRDRSDSRVTLDDFMRALWQRHGKPGGRADGVVDNPYVSDDLKSALGTVSGDPAFANDFFSRFVEGREVADYTHLLSRAGILVRRVAAGQATAGAFRLQDGPTGVRVVSAVPFESPAYRAGLERDDVLVTVAGTKLNSAAEFTRAVQVRKPGDSLAITFQRRGQVVSASLVLVEDARVQAVPAEEAGQTLSDAQRTFRDAWLGSRVRVK